MRAVNIKWDVTDGAEDMTKEEMDEILSTLPKAVKIPDYLITDDEGDLLDEVSDWLSDEYGFCNEVEYLDNDARTDAYAQEIVNETLKQIDDGDFEICD